MCLGMHVRASVSSREAGVRVGGQRVCVWTHIRLGPRSVAE